MKTYLRCKACGFILDASRLGEVCPACGVPKSQFEPYQEKVSESRKRILDAHLHPVMVHFPQAFEFTLLVLAILVLTARGTVRDHLWVVFQSLAWCLPVVVAGGFITGMVDGRVRFRRLTTPILRSKLLLASVFLIAAVVTAGLAWSNTVAAPAVLWALLGLQAVAFICSGLLGVLGTSLLDAKFPG
jgi:rubredoxin